MISGIDGYISSMLTYSSPGEYEFGGSIWESTLEQHGACFGALAGAGALGSEGFSDAQAPKGGLPHGACCSRATSPT